MSLSQKIGGYLPFLRRYARALCGSQRSGDNYVVAVLEAINTEPSMFDTTLDPRVSLYKSFSKIWNALPANLDNKENKSIADMRIETISPLPRQAFLLRTIEEFSTQDVATILDTDEASVSTLLEDASKEIAEQVSTKVLIIEDEPLISMNIEDLVKSLGHTVIGIARTHQQALAVCEQTKPGIILADIKLADDSSGIDAVKDLLKEFDVPVVFITAYPDRLLTGERPEPAFLITKPFNSEIVKVVMSQALFFDRKAGKSAA